MDYKQLADSIVENIGGVNNVSSVTHCVTRLRFILKDKNMVCKEAVDKLEGVVGSTFGAGQYQIILGGNLSPVYTAVVQNYNFTIDEVIDENLDEEETENKKKSNKIKDGFLYVINFLSACVTPMIPGLTVAGLIKVCLVLVNLVWSDASATQTYAFISNIVNATFYFLPVFVAYGTAKKLGCTPIYAMIVVCVLIHPNTMEMIKAGLNVFGITVYAASYTSTFLPAILSTIAVSVIEKFLDKHLPGMFKGVFVGGLTLVIASCLTVTLLGPIGAIAGTYFIQFLVWLQETIGPFALAFLGTFLPWIIMAGMHSVFGPVMLQSIAEVGYEGFLRPTQFIHNVAEGGACFGVAFRTRDAELRSRAISSGTGAILAGVSEPAIYGVNLPLKNPMYGVMAGGCAGGFVAGLLGVKAFSYGSPSLLALPIYESTIVGAILAALTSFAVSFAVTYVLGFKGSKNQK